MAEREDTTSRKIELRRARSRARHARLFAADPDYHKKQYRRNIERNPNINKERYRRALAINPAYNKEKRERSQARKIANGEYVPPPRRRESKNHESRRERDRVRYEKNKKAHIDRVVKRQRERYATDKSYVVYQNLRSRMRYAVKSQKSRRCMRNISLIGCSASDLAAHLEKQFLNGMSWNNRSQWHIDHIIPVSAFDLTTSEGQQAAFHYTNLRPLWASDNRRKSSKPPAGQRRFRFGYVMLADEQKKPRRVGSGQQSQGKETCVQPAQPTARLIDSVCGRVPP